jgi:hypothetical protein
MICGTDSMADRNPHQFVLFDSVQSYVYSRNNSKCLPWIFFSSRRVYAYNMITPHPKSLLCWCDFPVVFLWVSYYCQFVVHEVETHFLVVFFSRLLVFFFVGMLIIFALLMQSPKNNNPSKRSNSNCHQHRNGDNYDGGGWN